MIKLDGNLISGKHATGPLVWLSGPVSFWGGVDFATGLISDVHHPEHGQKLSDAIVCMPFGRGSSSSSSAIAEMARLGKLPAGFVLERADPILAIGVIVVEELYSIDCPIMLTKIEPLQRYAGASATIAARSGSSGTLEINPPTISRYHKREGV